MNKQEAIQRLIQEGYRIEPGQEFEIDRMKPEDAWGAVRCFYSVYGDEYPFEVNYVPELLMEENRQKKLQTVVARTPSGDIIACGALFLSSAYSLKVYEVGQVVVVPEYRSTFAALCIQDYIYRVLAPEEDIHTIFGEAVCNHLIIQKMSRLADFRESGLEVGLMPAAAYPMKDFPGERVSTLLGFKVIQDQPQTVFLPRRYAAILKSLVDDMDVRRDYQVSEAGIPPGSPTVIQKKLFEFAQVARFNLFRAGEDFPFRLEAEEQEADQAGCQVKQAFVNLGEAWSGCTVDCLKDHGYFFGGFLPRWFETDGLLMQKLIRVPDFASIQLESDRSRRILQFIRQDLADHPAGTG